MPARPSLAPEQSLDVSPRGPHRLSSGDRRAGPARAVPGRTPAGRALGPGGTAPRPARGAGHPPPSRRLRNGVATGQLADARGPLPPRSRLGADAPLEPVGGLRCPDHTPRRPPVDRHELGDGNGGPVYWVGHVSLEGADLRTALCPR